MGLNVLQILMTSLGPTPVAGFIGGTTAALVQFFQNTHGVITAHFLKLF